MKDWKGVKKMPNGKMVGCETPIVRKNSKSVEEKVGLLIGETKALSQRLAKINNNISGLVISENKIEKMESREEIVAGYFPRLIKALDFLGQNIESIRQQIDDLENI